MTAEVWMDKQNVYMLCVHYLAKRRLISVINCHNILKSDIVDDCSHYMQYTEKGEKIGNTNCISQCTWG
jgi:hypothetical protein